MVSVVLIKLPYKENFGDSGELPYTDIFTPTPTVQVKADNIIVTADSTTITTDTI